MLIKGRAERVSLERVSWVRNHARNRRTACYVTLTGTENSDSLTCTLIATSTFYSPFTFIHLTILL